MVGPERGRRVDAGGAAGGQPGGEQRGPGEDGRRDAERERVDRADAVELGLQQPARRHRPRRAGEPADGRGPRALAEHEGRHVAPARA